MVKIVVKSLDASTLQGQPLKEIGLRPLLYGMLIFIKRIIALRLYMAQAVTIVQFVTFVQLLSLWGNVTRHAIRAGKT